MAQRKLTIQPRFLEFIPEELQPGVLYVSAHYKTALHLCCCGCGQEVVTPLNKAGWEVHCSYGKVTMWPSIGNWDYPCQSHYFIKNNQVVWAELMTKSEIRRVKQRDEHERIKYLGDVNAAKVTSGELKFQEEGWRKVWLARLRNWINF